MRKILALPLFLLIASLGACGGSDSTDRATTGDAKITIDDFADLPKFGELPTDAVLHPPPLSIDQLEQLKLERTNFFESQASCMRDRGWNVTREKQFPDFLDFDLSLANFGTETWPEDVLDDLLNPDVPAKITGSITKQSSKTDAQAKIDEVNNRNPSLVDQKNRERMVEMKFQSHEEERAYRDDNLACYIDSYVKKPSATTPKNIEELAGQIRADPAYGLLDRTSSISSCLSSKGITNVSNTNDAILEPLRKWVESDIRPNFDEMHANERSIRIATLECSYANFRTMREVEIRYNRDAGSIK